jgi:very-short-patch-repair endonuclease
MGIATSLPGWASLTPVHTEALFELARRQHGVFARWQARDLGFSRHMIDRRVETKQWCVVMGCVLASSTTRLNAQGEAWSAYLACGRHAILSGPSALRAHGVDAYEEGPTWVTIPPERHVKFTGVRTIREAVPDTDIVEIDGMRVTSVARSVIDTLRVLPERIGQPLLDRALLRGWLSLDELAVRVDEFEGRRGGSRLKPHLARARSGARSEAEQRLHTLLDHESITGWTADFKVFDQDGVLRAVLDVAFARARVAIEIDGLAFHTDPEKFQRDRTRQNWLVNEGWTVLRFTWDDLMQRHQQVVQTIKAALNNQ